MCGKKKGNRRRTTLSLLNADAEALCLRPDPELVKVSAAMQLLVSFTTLAPSAGGHKITWQQF